MRTVFTQQSVSIMLQMNVSKVLKKRSVEETTKIMWWLKYWRFCLKDSIKQILCVLCNIRGTGCWKLIRTKDKTHTHRHTQRHTNTHKHRQTYSLWKTNLSQSLDTISPKTHSGVMLICTWFGQIHPAASLIALLSFK